MRNRTAYSSKFTLRLLTATVSLGLVVFSLHGQANSSDQAITSNEANSSNEASLSNKASSLEETSISDELKQNLLSRDKVSSDEVLSGKTPSDKAPSDKAPSDKTQSASASLRAKLSDLSSLAGKFVQQQFDQHNELIQSTNGDFWLKKPGLFRWHTQPPYEQLIISSNDKTWVYDPDLEQVSIHSNQGLNDGPVQLLSASEEDLDARFVISEEHDGEGLQEYRLDVKSEQQGEIFKTLIFGFAGDTLQSIKMFDQLGDLTEVSFSKLKRNKIIDESVFQFDIPDGTDVIADVEY
ncbi:MAG: outer membrane lipoprotein carrier protein [Flavobacteriales bacterium]|jgi:outer membrane lipoprotein carrier protein